MDTIEKAFFQAEWTAFAACFMGAENCTDVEIEVTVLEY